MKKFIICFLISAMVLCLLTACSDSKKDNSPEADIFSDGTYSKMSGDWPAYGNVKELIEKADIVFIGKVKEFNFQILDGTTALPATETTPDISRTLYTIYDIEVITPLKGNITDIENLRVMGGRTDCRTEEQLQIIKEGKADAFISGIPILAEYKDVQCEIGESYLFVLRQFETGVPTILNPEQSIYKLDDPLKYDIYGSASPKTIITEFGEDKWNDFYSQWKNDVFKSVSE